MTSTLGRIARVASRWPWPALSPARRRSPGRRRSRPGRRDPGENDPVMMLKLRSGAIQWGRIEGTRERISVAAPGPGGLAQLPWDMLEPGQEEDAHALRLRRLHAPEPISTATGPCLQPTGPSSTT